MTVNPYFNHYGVSTEQDLVADLVAESIAAFGLDVLYLPRTLVSFDSLLGEDAQSAFRSAVQIEMYISSFDAFGGKGDLLSKFGLEIRDELKLQVAKARFEAEIKAAGLSVPRPMEGDLIYFPLTKSVFEISFVEHEKPFYQHGKIYSYDITARLFEYSHETFATGKKDIDSMADRLDYTQVFSVSGTGLYTVGETVFQGASLAQATAKGVVVSRSASTVTIRSAIGDFVLQSAVKGNSSNVSRTLTAIDAVTNANDGQDDSDVLQQDSADAVDFSEKDPFGGF